MNKIIDNLYIGDTSDGNEVVSSNAYNFDAFLNVARLENYHFERKSSVNYFKFPIRESGDETNVESFISVFFALRYCMKRNYKTLVCCAAGKSRSPALVTLFLKFHFDLTVDQAFLMVKLKRKCSVFKPEIRKIVEMAVKKLQPLSPTLTELVEKV
jgi:protein-tyrosine phosphatase